MDVFLVCTPFEDEDQNPITVFTREDDAKAFQLSDAVGMPGNVDIYRLALDAKMPGAAKYKLMQGWRCYCSKSSRGWSISPSKSGQYVRLEDSIEFGVAKSDEAPHNPLACEIWLPQELSRAEAVFQAVAIASASENLVHWRLIGWRSDGCELRMTSSSYVELQAFAKANAVVTGSIDGYTALMWDSSANAPAKWVINPLYTIEV
jgi:hypothetical protein